MASVTFDHVYKRFQNVEVVHDINLEIKDKEFLVLVGPSGCGKSTCLRMVAGLEEITEGKLSIGDRVVNNVDPKDRDIAMVFQNYALYPHMSVYDNMAFGLKLRGFPSQDIKTRVEDAANILGLQTYLQRKPKELSGGQRQRVALGRALVRSAQVFLLDEPLSNLDAKLRVQTRAEISKIHQRVQTTFIYVTHDQTEAMTMGTRIAILNGGFIQQLGAPQDVYDHPANLFVAGFIGSPAMNFFDNAKVEGSDGQMHVTIDNVGQIDIPASLQDQAKSAAGKHLTFGIRPEHLSDAAVRPAESSNSKLTAPVDLVEHLGSELQVYLTAGGKSVTARLDPRSDAHVGGQVTLAVDTSKIHLFDTDSGEAIF